jgi:hypothetical protein
VDNEPVDVKVGDTVIVAGYRTTREHTVAKVARVWITLDNGWRFRRDTQREETRNGYVDRLYTLDQWANKTLRDKSVKFLQDQGIDVLPGSPWWNRRVELANILKAAIAAGEEST